jgi:drug/metabolite transporter (DMT)-like permease
MTSSPRATLIGSTAILLWGTLATLTVLSGDIPPFQLLAMAFTLATLIGFAWPGEGERPPPADHQPPAEEGRQTTANGSPATASGRWPAAGVQRLPLKVWALGIYGLFGYHFAYFMALRLAPPVEASLIAYLWPLLIVLMAALLPGERLGARQVGGALAGFAGAALLVARGGGLRFDGQYALGYAFALACAVIWSSYSVLSRRAGHVPTRAVAGFCAATAALALLCHLLFETTVWPAGWQWAAVVALGLGPVGVAFYVWDYGVKHGNIQTLGVLAYGAPLLSTLLLVAVGLAEPSWTLAAACVLIVGGAAIARG